MDINKIYQGSSFEVLKTFPDESINCCVTSPPYFGLRDYGMEGQVGMEETPELYVDNLVVIFEEVRRVLRKDGNLWLNLGDSYAGSGKGAETHPGDYPKQNSNRGTVGGQTTRNFKSKIYKPKDLIGIPWMVAFALRNSGWYLRQDIIWSKPNPMPESVRDRPTKAHEYIFLLSKSKTYYYDHESIKTQLKESSLDRLSQDIENQQGSDRVPGKTNGPMKAVGDKTDKQRGHSRRHAGFNDRWDHMTKEEQSEGGANKRSVWHVATRPFSEAHFAVFPQKLIEDCIKAGCPEGGVVLDPFMGSGTTAIVARKQNKNYVGIELNHDYIQIAERRIHDELGMFA